MRIAAMLTFSSQDILGATGVSRSSGDSDFSALLDEKSNPRSFISEEDLEARKTEQEVGRKAEKRAAQADVISQFLDYSEMTFAERIRATWLSDHNLTEEQLAALPDDQRKAIEDEIEEAVKRQLGFEGESGGSSAMVAAEGDHR
ncbi:hypothetical protein DFR48_105205 [Ciceribacter lividus]|uniref:Uncharacterized protein n=1 Tax=Ciceribacter lividus TaxID=1197950 RepID=A0A6I7HNQ4_9HYPH|nr:hypothetical protein [Ciceribacter lividus]RCW24860.1 hypothetical protein DFR48_105205 [Ciceribacter lividus]